MQTLEGKLSNKEIAEFLRNASKAMQRTIDSKSNSAISRQRPTHRRMRIAGHMQEEAERLQQIQRILEALAKAHETNNIVRFPFLEDIRNRKQIEILRRYNRLKELNHSIPNWLKNEQSTFDRLAIYTEEDWKQAFDQLGDLMVEFGNSKSIVDSKDDELLELEAEAELELLKMRVERERRKKNFSGESNEYESTNHIHIIDEAKARKTVPEIKISYSRDKEFSPVKATSGKIASDFVKSLFDENTIEVQEQFIILFLNRANNIIGYSKMFKGGITGTVADLRLIFATALKCLATGIIMSHNHPSGNLKPSDADVKLTQTVKEASRIMDVSLVDHIIVTSEGFFSFAEEGIL